MGMSDSATVHHRRRVGLANENDLLMVVRGFVLKNGFVPEMSDMMKLTGWPEWKVGDYFRRLVKQGRIARDERGLVGNWDPFAEMGGDDDS